MVDGSKMDVLFVSKFSPASTKLVKQLSANPDLAESIELVYVDNKNIREQVQRSSKLSITSVPCFIRMNEESGNVDVYEGEKAFDFFKSIQTKMEEEKRDAERQQKYESELFQLREEKKQAEEALAASQRQQHDQREQRSILKNSKVEIPQAVPIRSSTVAFTSIEELTDEPEENANLPKGINTFVHIEKKQEAFEAPPKRDEKTGSLMTKAAKMQKERDDKSTAF